MSDDERDRLESALATASASHAALYSENVRLRHELEFSRAQAAHLAAEVAHLLRGREICSDQQRQREDA